MRDALARVLAVARKDLLVVAKAQGALRHVVAACAVALPLLALASAETWAAGPWTSGAGRALALGLAALLSAATYSVAAPAAVSFAVERDKDTLDTLAVSPLSPRELVLGKLLAVLAGSLAAKSVALPALALAASLGGIELGFLPRYVAFLVATDVSFGALALSIGARPVRSPRRASALLKTVAPTQAQLALQRGVLLPVLSSLLPIYAIALSAPLAYSHGPQVARILEAAAPAGAIHPLLALLAWGDATVFGARMPVWLLGVAFHGLLALTFLASAAEAQRGPTGAPGRAPRAFVLALLVFTLAVATGATLDVPPARAFVAPAIAVAAVFLGAGEGGGRTERRGAIGCRDVIVPILRPGRALESAPSTSLGFAFLLAVASTPFVVIAGHGTGSAWSAAGAIALVGLATGAFLARRTAAEQAREALALEQAIARGAPVGEGKKGADDRAAPPVEELGQGGCAGFAALLVALPLLGGGGIALAQGPFPALSVAKPLLQGVAIVGVAANPLSALLPLLDPGPSGLSWDPLAPAFAFLGAERGTVFAIHVGLFALALGLALATIRKARDPAEVLVTSLRSGSGEKAGTEGPAAAPA